MPDKIADSLEAQRVGLGKGSRNDDMRVFQRQGHGVFPREIHISLVQNNDALLRAAKGFKFGGRVASAAGGVWRGQKG